MMTKHQSGMLERQQIRALSAVYGFDKSSSQLLSMSGLDSLFDRREAAADRFAQKLVANPRYGHLFPERPPDQLRARVETRNKYIETIANSTRMFNSPLYYLRRRLNHIEKNGITPSNAGRNGQDRNLITILPGTRNVPDTRCDFIYDEWR